MYNIHIINRYYPPNPAVTGEDACKLAAYILDNLPMVNVTIDYIDAPYPGGGSQIKPAGNMSGLRPLYKGRNKLLRFLGNFIEGYMLIRSALKKADVVISLTDPPLMNYWSGKFCGKKGVPWIYWSLDLYPEAFSAADLVGRRNFFYRYFDGSVRKNVPALLVALGEEQAKFIQQRLASAVPRVVLPCGIHKESANETRPQWRRDDNKVYFAYAGNLGEAHSHDFIIDFVNCLDAKKHKCILALYGARARQVIKTCKENPAVEIVDMIRRKDLFHVDVHLVSLKPQWTHICVPSKAVSAVCSNGLIIFNGLPASDTWQMFGSVGWIVNEFIDKEKRTKAIRAILSDMADPILLKEKRDKLYEVKERLYDLEKHAYRGIAEYLQGALTESAGEKKKPEHDS